MFSSSETHFGSNACRMSDQLCRLCGRHASFFCQRHGICSICNSKNARQVAGIIAFQLFKRFQIVQLITGYIDRHPKQHMQHAVRTFWQRLFYEPIVRVWTSHIHSPIEIIIDMLPAPSHLPMRQTKKRLRCPVWLFDSQAPDSAVPKCVQPRLCQALPSFAFTTSSSKAQCSSSSFLYLASLPWGSVQLSLFLIRKRTGFIPCLIAWLSLPQKKSCQLKLNMYLERECMSKGSVHPKHKKTQSSP